LETKRTLPLNGFRLAYWIDRPAGARQTLIMLHGLASNHTRWSEFVAHTRLRGRWTLVRPDLRGHGESMYRGRISRPRWVADLHRLAAVESLAPAVVAGHSLGAEIALDWALAHPRDCAGLILVDPVVPGNLRGILGVLRRLRWLLWLPILVLWFCNALGLRKRHFPQRDLWALDRQTRATLAAHPELSIADLYTRPQADFPYIPMANYLQDHFEVSRPLPPLERITQPVLVIRSRRSALEDAGDNDQVLRHLADVTFADVDCDHWPLTEKPDTVRRIIDDWCRRRFEGEAVETTA